MTGVASYKSLRGRLAALWHKSDLATKRVLPKRYIPRTQPHGPMPTDDGNPLAGTTLRAIAFRTGRLARQLQPPSIAASVGMVPHFPPRFSS